MIETLSSRLSDIGAAWTSGAGGAFIVLVGLAIAGRLRAARIRRTGCRRYLAPSIAGALAARGSVPVLIGSHLKATAIVHAEV